MIYEFLEVKPNGVLGAAKDLEFHHSEVPGIGERITVDGTMYQRIPSLTQARVDDFMDEPFVSHSLPKNYEPHKKAGGKFTKDGKPVFESKRQVSRTEVAARNFSVEDDVRHPGLKPLLNRDSDG